MTIREVFMRTAKLLGKVILGLLIVLLILAALLHLPPVQKKITHRITNYLSSKLDTRVEIGSISFSIRGHVLINDLNLWDRQDVKILTAGELEVSTGILNLIKGDYIFDKVRIVGFDGKLDEQEEGLNIQFILDAFVSEKTNDAELTSVILQFISIELEDGSFTYTSSVNGTTVNTRLAKFTIEAAQYSTHPNVITAGKVLLQQSALNILNSYPEFVDAIVNADTLIGNNADGSTGFTVSIADLEITESDFSYHKNKITTTSKFDPEHLEVHDIQLRLTESFYRDDTLALSLQELSARFPEFDLDRAAANVRWNHNRMEFSGVKIISGTNEVEADGVIWYDSLAVKSIAYVNTEITAELNVNPKDLSYFLSDSVMDYFKGWDTTTLKLEGSYIAGRGDVKQLILQSGNSRLLARGKVNDVWNTDRLNWSDVVLNASLGSAFNSTLAPFLKTINLPPQVALELASFGALKEAKVIGKVSSAWGNAAVTGILAQQPGNFGLDLTMTGDKVDPGKWMGLTWMGPVTLTISAKGRAGEGTNMDVSGVISSIVLLDQSIKSLEFKSSIRKSDATVAVSIKDPDYQADILSEISFVGPLMLTNSIQFEDFKMGRLFGLDSALTISGDTESTLAIDGASLEGYMNGRKVLLKNQNLNFFIDSLSFHAVLSPTASAINYYSEYGSINLVSNFDIREANDAVQSWSKNMLESSDGSIAPEGNRTATITMALEKANFFQLLGIDVDEFSSLAIIGEFDEQKQTVLLNASSGKFKGYGMALDTLQANLTMLRDSATAMLNAENLWYGSVWLGDLDVDLRKKGKSATANLLLSADTLTVLNWQAHMVNADSGLVAYTDSLRAFDRDYILDPENAVIIGKNTVAMHHVRISRDSVEISIEGDLNAFEVTLSNLDLSTLDLLLFPDTTVISKGYLNGNVSYIRDQQLNLSAGIDSLSLYGSSLITITATAASNGNEVPFQFMLTSSTNTVDLKGNYFYNNAEVDASVTLDVNEPELFAFLISDFIESMDGSLKGEATIKGRMQQPAVTGYLQFLDVGLTTVNPQLPFSIKEDRITLDNYTLSLDDFTLYDTDQNPLVINGTIISPDYQSYTYDLHIKSDNYALINNSDAGLGRVSGVLVLDSDIKLRGNDKDTNVDARITVKDATKLTFVLAIDDIELLHSEGIVDFVDPALLNDTIAVERSPSYYDSLIASLPSFTLSSSIMVENKASIRIIINEQSGDYLETSGNAALELGYNRTGNLSLSGTYTIRNGVYRLSFYDLVKRNFDLVEGSSITWSGSPENGDLSIKAVHAVESNSLGLIGHEIGENEKTIYKRSLNYEVGININGTIERPIISFSLDLPVNDKASFPVLANKLDRLRQPEYESELNKQVFGLLVLGGFLPESSGSDFNSSLIATTALSNSVNSLLASQLNKFANQYIRGFNIDVGIQSYNDFSAPGGQAQTAMDFRVSKSIMDDRLSFEIGGDFDINADQSGANTGTKNYRGDVAIIYDLTGNGDKQLKLFNNETYDIVYQEIRNTGISLIFIREFSRENKKKNKEK
jgi:translocation and assembly module TamB